MLETSISYLKGIGPQRADMIQKELNIFTYQDLLEHFPFRYIDRTKFHKIKDLRDDNQFIQLRGILRRFDVVGSGRKSRLVAVFRDETGVIELIWFKGVYWIEKTLKPGAEYVVFGKPSRFNGKFNMAHPDIEPASTANTSLSNHFQAVYSVTEKLRAKKLDSKAFLKIQKILFNKLEVNQKFIVDPLPDYLIEKFKFPGRYQALKNIHFPTGQEALHASQNRLKFEELFLLQLRLLKKKSNRRTVNSGFVFDKVGEHFNGFYNNNLKFELTGAQKRVLKEIRRDLGLGRQMNRLLQGDVGSGKTVVGFMSMLLALDNDYQAALMAPTEILAQQHYQAMLEMASGLGIRIALLTGTVKGKKRTELLKLLAAGELDILLGTHALIEDPVVFKNLGLVIVDEQHRFGVVQRAKMWRKSKPFPPHILVMTATPIPRTLAMTLYGDLDVSIIDEMPAGRKPIKTLHKYDSHRLRVFGMMKEQIAMGHQVYVVYPLIEESEYEGLEDIKDLMDGYESICREFPRPDYEVSIVHGKMKPADKDYEMQRFIKQETQIMVATTVIEVGVNVPNATMMVIENSERFGLAQLHQLRGRVGRGGDQAYCVLMTSYKLSKEGRFRMETMVGTTNGFEIADADLKLRGPGNIEGTEQSGILDLKMADLGKDGKILQVARHIAETILDADPNLEKEEHKRLKWFLQQNKKKTAWSEIS